MKLETFYNLFCFYFNPTFKWVDFFSPSTLHLAPFVKTILEPVGKNNDFNLLELGVHEALVNAVKHGNASDPSKNLRVRRIITPNWFVLQIQDEGNGIPVESRISILPNELEVENGRGLFLIHECFDDVRWSPKGNRLQLASRR
tara:strand:- start:580 stop:1011 length:432 start_codon:yes stop_codon:yes gene_type:complete